MKRNIKIVFTLISILILVSFVTKPAICSTQERNIQTTFGVLKLAFSTKAYEQVNDDYLIKNIPYARDKLIEELRKKN